MAFGTRSRLIPLAALVAAIAVVRELSIRRHEGDLTDWPQHDSPDQQA